MKKFIHSDWLRAVQFFLKHRRKELIQCKKRKQTKHSDRSMIKETHRWPIKSSLLSNHARALDGAIDGTIFPWLRDTRAFLLLNHHQIFFTYINK